MRRREPLSANEPTRQDPSRRSEANPTLEVGEFVVSGMVVKSPTWLISLLSYEVSMTWRLI